MLMCIALFVSLSTVHFHLGATNKVTTLPATNVTSTSATLNASVEPDGCGGKVEFAYVEAANLLMPTEGKKVSAETLKSISTSKRTISYNLTGLNSGTEYVYFGIASSSCSASDVSYGSKVTFTTSTRKKTVSIIPMTFAPPNATAPPGGSFPPPPTPVFTGGTPPPPVPGGTTGPAPPGPPIQCPGPQPPLQPTQFPPPQPSGFPSPQPPQTGLQNMTLYIGMGIIGLLLIVLIILIVVMMSRGKRPPKIYSSR